MCSEDTARRAATGKCGFITQCQTGTAVSKQQVNLAIGYCYLHTLGSLGLAIVALKIMSVGLAIIVGEHGRMKGGPGVPSPPIELDLSLCMRTPHAWNAQKADPQDAKSERSLNCGSSIHIQRGALYRINMLLKVNVGLQVLDVRRADSPQCCTCA